MQGETLRSVGIDIGTASTQCVLSRLTLINTAPAFAIARIAISRKEVLYRAPLLCTPLAGPDTIDAEAVQAYVQKAYAAAGVGPGDIDTGAVIITGQTARKHNARAVVEALSGMAGAFVVATAGPLLEGVLAGRGSGACEASRTRGLRVMNLDIGGGTANLCVFARGEPLAAGCVEIGGRLLRWDAGTGEVLHVTAAAELIARDAGVALRVGGALSPGEAERLARRMAGVLAEAAGLAPRTPLHDALVLEAAVPADMRADAYMFSGGVAEGVYGAAQSPLFMDDLGPALSRALLSSQFFTHARVLAPREMQSATVIGAGAYSMEVSGSTIAYADGLLPLRGLPVGRVRLEAPEDISGIPQAVQAQRALLGDGLAIGFAGLESPAYAQIERLADALAPVLPREAVLVMERDMAAALGQALMRRRGEHAPLVCIDGVALRHGDQIDIGEPLAGGRVLPVVVKTFAFAGGEEG